MSHVTHLRFQLYGSPGASVALKLMPDGSCSVTKSATTCHSVPRVITVWSLPLRKKLFVHRVNMKNRWTCSDLERQAGCLHCSHHGWSINILPSNLRRRVDQETDISCLSSAFSDSISHRVPADSLLTYAGQIQVMPRQTTCKNR